jgi:hypothetical protein
LLKSSKKLSFGRHEKHIINNRSAPEAPSSGQIKKEKFMRREGWFLAPKAPFLRAFAA